MKYDNEKSKGMVRDYFWPAQHYGMGEVVDQLDAAIKEIEILRNGIKCDGHEWEIKPCPRCGGYDEINCNVEKRCVKCGVLWPRMEMPI